MSYVERNVKLLQHFYFASVQTILSNFEDFSKRVKTFLPVTSTEAKDKSKLLRDMYINDCNTTHEVFMRMNAEFMATLNVSVERQCWVKPRSSKYWEEDVRYYSDSDWIQNFRMRRADFCELVEILYDEMSPSVAYVRHPVPVDKRIAIAIYKLASCAEYRTVGNLFGVSKRTVGKFLFLFCDAVMKKLFPTTVCMPTSVEAFELAFRLQLKHNIPMCFAFIDGTHIPILPPKEGRKDFLNRKMYPSIVLQAVVDADCKFRNISCKMPGSAHDASVLKASNIYQNPSKFIPEGTQNIDGNDIPFYIFGDPAYPLLPWLLKGYTYSQNMCPLQESYNVYMSSARISVEMAFGRLKGRWRILLKRIDLNYKQVPKLVAACCALNNFCERRNIPMPVDTDEALCVSEAMYPQPHQRQTNMQDLDAKKTRDNLCKYMASKNPLRKSFR